VVGPFVGTLLDRFSRQRAILFSNLIRAATLLIVAHFIYYEYPGPLITAVVLIAFGVNRLILAGLSAGIPLMTTPQDLISANAIAVTGGSVWVVLGGGLGLGLRKLLMQYLLQIIPMPSLLWPLHLAT
jgi:MFS family permease